jgi:hypothetical protein
MTGWRGWIVTDLVVFVPSRGRPDACRDLVATFDDTCGEDTRLVFAVDRDDPELSGYVGLGELDGVTVFINDNLGSMNRALNAVCRRFMKEFPFVGFMGDDHRPRTDRWDQWLLESLTSNPGAVVYGNDLFQAHKLPTQVFMDSRIVRTLGWFAPPEMSHMYLDNFWLELGRRLGTLTYLPDVVIEHMHPVAHKGEWDETYKQTNTSDVYQQDHKAFQEYVFHRLDADVAKVREVLS